jgi:3',5'-cyclic AMP phosphodiesterase CpdA
LFDGGLEVGMNDGHGVPRAVENRWEDLIADTEATAEEYENAGYETLTIQPGDVVVLEDDLAVDVLAPGNEYRPLTDLMETVAVDEFDVYTAEEGGVDFAMVVAADHDAAVAVCVPLYMEHADADDLAEATAAAGYVEVHVRPLSDDERVAFRLEEPELLFERT